MSNLLLIIIFLQGLESSDTLRVKLEEIFETASKWGVGENRDRVKKAREDLASYGRDALEFLFQEKIKTLKTTELRAILAVIKKNKKDSTPYLVKALKNENDTVRRAALWLCAKSKDTLAVPTILEVMNTETAPRMIARALYALGEIGDTSAVKDVIRFLDSDNEMIRVRAASAFANMADKTFNDLYFKMLLSEDFQIRYQGVKGIAKIGKDGIDWILTKIEEVNDFRIHRLLMRALSKILETGTVDEITKAKIRQTLFVFIDREDPVLRTYTVEAMSRIGGESVVNLLRKKIETETHPLVRWQIKEVLTEYQ